MASISIELPALETDQSIEIEVKINGHKRKFNYRVEILAWSECPQSGDRIECLRSVIKKHDPQWQVIQIGAPTEQYIPLMFKQISN